MKEWNVSGTACIDRDSRENSGVVHIKEEEENGNFEIIILIMKTAEDAAETFVFSLVIIGEHIIQL